MPLSLDRITEASTGWTPIFDQIETDIEDFVNALEADIINHPHQDVNNDQSVTFDDVNITTPSDIFDVMDLRYFTQAETLELIAGAIFSFWPSDTADGVIGGYNRMFDDDTGEAKSSIGPVTIDAAEVLIASFITKIDSPDFAALAAAVYNLEIHSLATTGANIKDARLRWKLYSRTQPGGVETLLITSEDGAIIMDTECHCSLPGLLPTETPWTPTDRLVLKIYGVPEGAEPQDPDVTIFMEGDTAARIETHTTLGVFDQRYLMLNGSNEMAADLDMGGHDLVDVGLVDTVDVAALKTDVDGFPDRLKFLTAAEIQQLENIGATTISAAQWALLGGASALGGYTDRGDPGVWDWTQATLTIDGGWHELDLSAIVPAGNLLVLFYARIASIGPNYVIQLRNADDVGAANKAEMNTQVAGILRITPLLVVCNATRKIDCLVTNGATDVKLSIRGWWSAT